MYMFRTKEKKNRVHGTACKMNGFSANLSQSVNTENGVRVTQMAEDENKIVKLEIVRRMFGMRFQMFLK